MYQRYINTQFSINEQKCTKTVKYKVKDSLEWWQLIFEKRCDGYLNLQEYDCYNEALWAFLT